MYNSISDTKDARTATWTVLDPPPTRETDGNTTVTDITAPTMPSVGNFVVENWTNTGNTDLTVYNFTFSPSSVRFTTDLG
mmetsp:Transcript_17149/g.21381  ORF Transcript_17149/g.21381 Transcript_17149/m.21381 type:complete len:80 (+) Transcript_17149:209-448(+)|eukprot:CAMPEP_0172511604 /NCGR_PEP_ID=MMETSP1066-20121228/237640_1 /TAXON_ID=671091 /ORGANISM="Coscinodiscus wailesii, Strain CCMP2513" /LENGTH=79 /DNA_ID=CAMNT_0013291051 /DNA_START=335 /DNA_END=574 /DNA_ORIENTATION=+